MQFAPVASSPMGGAAIFDSSVSPGAAKERRGPRPVGQCDVMSPVGHKRHFGRVMPSSA
jgi:hypothetical protein